MTAVTVRGEGRVVVAAFGVADAEHAVERELAALWPEGRVSVLEVRRTGDARIVEEFEVAYRVRGAVEAEGEGDAASRAALRRLRERLAGSRFERLVLEVDRGTEVAR